MVSCLVRNIHCTAYAAAHRGGQQGNHKGRTRGNGFWRHYVHTDAQGVESHIKVIKKEKGFEFFTGMVSGELIPDSESEKDDKEADSGAEEAASPAKSITPAPDTNALPAGWSESAAARFQTKLRRLRPPQGMARPARRRRSAVDIHRSKWRRHLCIRYVPVMVYRAVSDVYECI